MSTGTIEYLEAALEAAIAERDQVRVELAARLRMCRTHIGERDRAEHRIRELEAAIDRVLRQKFDHEGFLTMTELRALKQLREARIALADQEADDG